MAQAFIIMQIGNMELDKVCESAIVPAIEACGLCAKRVDKHNEGGILKSEIISFIQNSDIIIADLTNERQNCYLEIGYTMGLDKFKHLILTAREDHFPESPNYVQGGPKIHFDLAGYDILTWSASDIPTFKAELEKRIRHRLLITESNNKIICPVCKLSVSNQAKSCTRCGYPLMKPEFKAHEVVTRGSGESSPAGKRELDSLVADGWEILNYDDYDTWVDSEGYECRAYKYKLRKWVPNIT